jgi:hypothetical protein
MKRQTKFDSEEHVESQAGESVQATVREFKTAEEMLRHDALHTPVPPTIAHRLEESIGPPSPRAQPWWRRWFGLPNS